MRNSQAYLAMSRRIALAAALLCAPLPAIAHEIAEIAFVGSPEWAILSPGSIKPDELIIRRYAFKVSKESYSAARSDPAAKLNVVDPPGTIINSMFFICRRKSDETDVLVLHLPDTVSMQSFPYEEWKSTIGIRTLADGKSRAVQGEYIKGDLFIDAKDMAIVDFIALMSSTELIFEFGDKADRGRMIFEEKTGATKMKQLIHDVLPGMVKHMGAQRVQFLTTSQALAACDHFKKTGHP